MLMNPRIAAPAPLATMLLNLRPVRKVNNHRYDMHDDFNFTQIFRTPILQPEFVNHYLVDHLQMLEFTLLLGKRLELHTGGHLLTQTGGVAYWAGEPKLVSKNWLLETAAYDGPWAKYGRGGLKQGTEIKYLFVPPELHLPELEYRKVPTIAAAPGVDYRPITSPGGLKLRVIALPSLRGHRGAFLLDLNHLQLVQYRKIQLLLSRQSPNDPIERGEWLSDLGLDLDIPAAHQHFKLSD